MAMTLNRRQLGVALGGALGGTAAACAAPGRPLQAEGRFLHGVASGDPATDGVLLWTRLTTDAPEADLVWEISGDDSFARILKRGRAVASAARDHTVKVEVDGLRPGREYRYRFRCGDQVSPMGRTRTLPEAGDASAVRLAVASCALYSHGYFNAYEAIANLGEVHAVLHLGDYIYEYASGPRDYGAARAAELGRMVDPPHETVTLADYRRRHAQVKADPQAQAAHARCAWIVTFDDHEITNDPWTDGAQNHQPDEGDWAARKAAALQAWFEWMPIRDRGPNLALAARRAFRFGRTASLHMLETRLLARSEQLEFPDDAGDATAVAAFRQALESPARSLLGPEQLTWLEAGLGEAVRDAVAWQLLGQQTPIGRQSGVDLIDSVPPETLAGLSNFARNRIRQMALRKRQGLPQNTDDWGGYPAERERLYAAAGRAGANLVVLTGDSHANWVHDLHDAGGRRAGTELGATAISSPPPSLSRLVPGMDMAAAMTAQNPEVLFAHFGERGFLDVTLTPERAEARFVGVSTLESRAFETREVARFEIRPGQPPRRLA
ncbi:alkaline phosphatase D family protein [Brevundimonas sp. 2R-24]|uniref:Alkaline phosphatase D family protein n=1 Tax=Peiella sedimenti TaxID=3061083 RepID=A0ABT8SM89_9CAUL|nr:alkaline phosphatase D family protein [Caulobacteraceae bacterium XZ-24]